MAALRLKLLFFLIKTCILLGVTLARNAQSFQHDNGIDHPQVEYAETSKDSERNKHQQEFGSEVKYATMTPSPLSRSKLPDLVTSTSTVLSEKAICSVATTNKNSSCRVNKYYVNCSNSDLKSIPTTQFPRETQVYDLSNNHIKLIPSQAFSDYPLLKELRMPKNLISEIHPLAFIGLSNLEFLDLSANKLVMDKTVIEKSFTEHVFSPLKKLKKLRLERNNPYPNDTALQYPHQALSHLVSLEELCIDGLINAVFKSGFANLKLLRNLSIDGFKFGHCIVYGLKNETFENLRSLEHLSMTNCNLKGYRIEAGTFLPLKRLISLNISHNQDINVQHFDRVFYGLQNTTSLRTLSMQFVVNLYTLGLCLSSKYIKHFPQSVEHLNVAENKLECVDRHVIDKIKHLKTLDLSRNNFVFGTYLLDLPKLKNLTDLYLDNYLVSAYRLPKIYPYNPHTPPLETANCTLYASGDLGNNKFILRLPPNLKVVRFRYVDYQYIFSRLEVDTPNNLEVFYMEGNYIPTLEGPVIGLEGLRSFDMIANKVEHITEEFFEAFPSLVNLNLSSNYLGDFFNANPHTKLFQRLVKLEKLDLSRNIIRVLGPNVFQGLGKLMVLRISYNPIQFYSDISMLKSLQNLIAVSTNIAYLSKDTRNAIDQRIEMGMSFNVELQESPISCDCENLSFLKWMVTCKAFNFKQNKKYLCSYPDKSSKLIVDAYVETVETLTRQCSSHEDLLFAVGAVTLFLLLIIGFGLIYRFRWKLRYLYHAAYIHLRPSNTASSNDRYEYDVFVCYADEDKHFVMDIMYPALHARRVSVFLHHRHFTAGELIGSNIVRAVHTCRRTVIVLTRNLSNSSWCKYEIQMANMESAHRGTPVLIFLLFDDMTGREMGAELLYNVKNNTYITIPSDPNGNDAALDTLWDRLARDIKH